VLDLIGTGATGAVYAAVDDTIGRRVAIKVLGPALAADADACERFRRAALRAAQLVHPNVVTMLDLGDENGRPFVVMEYLRGSSLRDCVQGAGVRSLDAKIGLMVQVCDGVAAAHDRGVVHGRLSPASVFVTTEGAAKVVDFGVSALGGAPTPYAPPEQVRGEPPDERADLFSTAAVCYFILTGQAPFGDADPARVRSTVLHGRPAALTAREAPEALARAVMRGLAARPEDRQSRVSQLRAEVDSAGRARESGMFRTALAAFDRYTRLVALIEERRALGRRLGLADVDRECDRKIEQLARHFPDLARAARASALPPAVDVAVSASVLADLQRWYNDELASVAVLRAAAGAGRKRDAS
jgi:serine/threonine protein kinase